jgi:hypothetical protein
MRNRKNISRPVSCQRVAVDFRNRSQLAVLDKSPVIALSLMRRKFVKNPTDSIRCKFSIDVWPARWAARPGGIHHFETIPGIFRKPDVHHLTSKAARKMHEKPANAGCLPQPLRALAFI